MQAAHVPACRAPGCSTMHVLRGLSAPPVLPACASISMGTETQMCTSAPVCTDRHERHKCPSSSPGQ